MSTNGSVLVGTWQLQETAAKPESAEDPIPVDHGGEEGESTFDVDKRELVPPTDYGPGGKFRCKCRDIPFSFMTQCNNQPSHLLSSS